MSKIKKIVTATGIICWAGAIGTVALIAADAVRATAAAKRAEKGPETPSYVFRTNPNIDLDDLDTASEGDW